MEYNYEDIGERISNERKKLKNESGKSWTQEDMLQYLKSKNLGISRNTLSALENGSSVSIDFNIMLEFCKLFDCELGFLLCEKGYENRTRKQTDIVLETGLSQTAVEVLTSLKKQHPSFHMLPTCNDDTIILNDVLLFVNKLLSYENIEQLSRMYVKFAFEQYHYNIREHDYDKDNDLIPSEQPDENAKRLLNNAREKEMLTLGEFMHFLTDTKIDREFFREAEVEWHP